MKALSQLTKIKTIAGRWDYESANGKIKTQSINSWETMPAFFHPGQAQLWKSEARFPCAVCGAQSGKTVFGPYWLIREIARKGTGDYIVIAPTKRLLDAKLVNQYRKILKQFANTERRFVKSESGVVSKQGYYLFEFPESAYPKLGLTGKTQIFFVTGSNPNQLESYTLNAAHFDECGQNGIPDESFEAIIRRLSITEGRCLFTTTPYDWNAFKTQFIDPCERGEMPEVEIINFKSTMNPSFSDKEYETRKRTMQSWRFRMMYDGIYTRPAGSVYDCFDEDLHVVKDIAIPSNWPRFIGHDFGTVNAATCHAAMNPETGDTYVYRSWRGGGATESQTQAIKKDEPYYAPRNPGATPPAIPVHSGGAPGENEWRDAYAKEKIYVSRPQVESILVGVATTYALFVEKRLFILDNPATEQLRKEIPRYSYKLSTEGDPTGEIDHRTVTHRIDALRYLALVIPRKEELQPQTAENPFDIEYQDETRKERRTVGYTHVPERT